MIYHRDRGLVRRTASFRYGSETLYFKPELCDYSSMTGFVFYHYGSRSFYFTDSQLSWITDRVPCRLGEPPHSLYFFDPAEIFLFYNRGRILLYYPDLILQTDKNIRIPVDNNWQMVGKTDEQELIFRHSHEPSLFFYLANQRSAETLDAPDSIQIQQAIGRHSILWILPRRGNYLLRASRPLLGGTCQWQTINLALPETHEWSSFCLTDSTLFLMSTRARVFLFSNP